MEPRSDEVSIDIAAPPERVWGIVADITGMGRHSPVCRSCEWLDGAERPAVGARFLGRNCYLGVRWTRECVIKSWDPPREFSFQTVNRGSEETLWTYRVEPIAEGTRVTESYWVADGPWYVKALYSIPGTLRKSRSDLVNGMRRTLENIKRAAEAPGD